MNSEEQAKSENLAAATGTCRPRLPVLVYIMIVFRFNFARAPHWPEKYAKSLVFSAFEANFCPKNEISYPQRDFGAKVVKELP